MYGATKCRTHALRFGAKSTSLSVIGLRVVITIRVCSRGPKDLYVYIYIYVLYYFYAVDSSRGGFSCHSRPVNVPRPGGKVEVVKRGGAGGGRPQSIWLMVSI